MLLSYHLSNVSLIALKTMRLLVLTAMINFYILSKSFFLKLDESSDARAVTIAKKIWFCSKLFIKIHESQYLMND